MFTIINGRKWLIRLVEPQNRQLRNSQGVSVLGVTDGNVNTIYINNRLNAYMYHKVLTHELVHAFCFSYRVSLDIEDEEIMADFIATFGSDILDQADDICRCYRRLCE